MNGDTRAYGEKPYGAAAYGVTSQYPAAFVVVGGQLRPLWDPASPTPAVYARVGSTVVRGRIGMRRGAEILWLTPPI